MNKMMTESELQFLEHCNKIMNEHEESMLRVAVSTQTLLNEFLPGVKSYVQTIANLQRDFSIVVQDMLRSTRELKLMAGNTQELIAYTKAVTDLNKILNDETMEKLIKLSKIK